MSLPLDRQSKSEKAQHIERCRQNKSSCNGCPCNQKVRGDQMVHVRLHVNGKVIEQDVKENANLVVMAGLRQLPELKYGCGIGRCTKCVSKVISGGEQLDEPNWKEKKMLGELVNEGYRLTCQLTITDDIELSQENVQVKKNKQAPSESNVR
jgi:ferredoxin